MATFTMSDQLATPRQNAVGITYAKGVYTAGGTLTASDIILGVKVPHGAIIVDGYISGHIDNAATLLKVGVIGAGATLVDTNLITTPVTLSATAVLKRFDGGGLPVTVSLSDNRTTRYANVTITVNTAGSNTATASVVMVVGYLMPGNI